MPKNDFYKAQTEAGISHSINWLAHGLNNLQILIRLPARAKDVSRLQLFKHALGSIQPVSQWELRRKGLFFRESRGQGVKLIIHLHIQPQLRMSGGTNKSTLPIRHHDVYVEKFTDHGKHTNMHTSTSKW